MTIETHQLPGATIAEVITENIVIGTAADGLDLVGNLYYGGFEGVILPAHGLAPAFFELKTGLAGEILQKFSNYRMRLAIVGDWSKHHSPSFTAFMAESNRGAHICFVGTTAEAIERLMKGA